MVKIASRAGSCPEFLCKLKKLSFRRLLLISLQPIPLYDRTVPSIVNVRSSATGNGQTRNGQPVIKGVGEPSRRPNAAGLAGKGKSLWRRAHISTSCGASARPCCRRSSQGQDAFARGYENYKRKMGGEHRHRPSPTLTSSPETTHPRRSATLEAERAVKEEQFAAQKAAMKPQPAAPATGPSLRADAAATSVLEHARPCRRQTGSHNQRRWSNKCRWAIGSRLKSQQMVQPTVTAPVVGPPHILRTEHQAN